MRAQPGVLDGEVVPPRAGGRVHQVGLVDVDAQLAGLAADLAGVAEQGQVGHPAAEQDLGRAQDPLVGALGQHQPSPVRAGPVDQVVLEHQRGDPGGPGDRQPPGQLGGVHGGLEGAQRGLHLARVRRARSALDPAGRGHRVVAVALHREHGQAGAEPFDQAHHPWVGLFAEGQHQPGHRDLAGDVRRRGGHQQVGPVARGDHQGAVGQMVEQGRHVRRAHHVVEHVPVQRGPVAGQQGGAERRRHLGHRRRRHGRHLGNRVRRHRQVRQRHRSGHPVGDHRQHGRTQVLEIVVRAAGRRRDRLRLLVEPVDHRQPPRCRTRWPAGR